MFCPKCTSVITWKDETIKKDYIECDECKFHLPKSIPWMSDKERELIASSLVNKNVNMLEWGIGRGTLYWYIFVTEYFGIEHDLNWFTMINNEIEKLKLKNINIYRSNIKEDYLFLPYFLEVKKFDRIIIDGRSRKECAILALGLLKDDGLLFIHDFYRDKLDEHIFRWYYKIDGVDELVVLQKRV